MSNFAFAKAGLPTVYPDCVRAESHLAGDPAAACFYSRRAVERLVEHLYDVLALTPPYRNDLNARINDAAFRARVGDTITGKLNVIRTVGNRAAHESRPISPSTAGQVLRELFHVVIYTAYHHSADPQAVPTGTQFDPALAAQLAPIPRAELARIAAQLSEQDEAHRRELAEREDLAQAKDAEIAELKAQIAAAQAANREPDDHDYSEADTRTLLIDVLLAEAGWALDGPNDREYLVDAMDTPSGKGRVDYVLWGVDGKPLAVIEAKRTTKSPEAGRHQAKLYADALEAKFGRRPIIYYTNGYEHWLWDDAAFPDAQHPGYPPRQVQGFLTRDELELMIQRRQTRRPLSAQPIDAKIVERYYQTRAIKAVCDAFDARQREALLVMATGSGKTRTAIALVDQLMKANWVKRVLFLADRVALVNQAVGAFKAHLPSAPTVNLVTERDASGRVYAATYPTMLNLLGEADGPRRFAPASSTWSSSMRPTAPSTRSTGRSSNGSTPTCWA